MMDEDKLYNDLKNHISEVFDNYEDTTANEGWLLLRELYPEKEDRKPVAWWPWFGAAAVLLLALGLWILPKKQQDDNKGIVRVKQSAPAQQQKPAITRVDSVAPTSIATKNAEPTNVLAGQNNKPEGSLQAPANKHTSSLGAVRKVAEDDALQIARDNPVNKQVIVTTQPQRVSQPVDSVKSQVNDRAVIAANTNPITEKPGITAQASNQAVVSNKMDKLLNDSPLGNKDAQNKKDTKVALSVYAATYFNYANGSDNQLNVGAGFTSDFKLSGKLKLVTGVAIAQNSLNYNNDRPTGKGGNVYAADVVSSSPAAGFNFQNSSPSTTSYNASMVGLDVPLNLKYQFDPDKSDTFISAGLSSGTFINETYTTSYNYINTSKQSVQKASFSRFDFARTLNLSFGMGYPLGKSNRLIVEPFLKYPLGGLGEQNIRFGAGGINLKLSFQSLKK